MIVEGFDNAWHVLRHWRQRGHECFTLEAQGRIPFPSPCAFEDIPAGAVAGVDYLPIPPLAEPAAGDNPHPERTFTAAEIILATAIAEGWEPMISDG
ncbi:MAG: hypothetical protein ACRD9R_12950 [Pyrinomonadaceae bacterium]